MSTKSIQLDADWLKKCSYLSPIILDPSQVTPETNSGIYYYDLLQGLSILTSGSSTTGSLLGPTVYQFTCNFKYNSGNFTGVFGDIVDPNRNTTGSFSLFSSGNINIFSYLGEDNIYTISFTGGSTTETTISTTEGGFITVCP
jgi:hypothetical protein